MDKDNILSDKEKWFRHCEKLNKQEKEMNKSRKYSWPSKRTKHNKKRR